MQINNKEELYQFLKLNIPEIGSYALVTYDNKTEAIWVTRYDNFNDGDDWFLESPCELHTYETSQNELKDMSDEQIKNLCILLYGERYSSSNLNDITGAVKGTRYSIDNFQVAPYLPHELDDLTLISEDYCINWLIKQEENNNEKVQK